jgi:hypothetical protein
MRQLCLPLQNKIGIFHINIYIYTIYKKIDDWMVMSTNNHTGIFFVQAIEQCRVYSIRIIVTWTPNGLLFSRLTETFDNGVGLRNQVNYSIFIIKKKKKRKKKS